MPTPIGRHHSEWLNLLAEVSGPFLSLPVLQEALPQGLEDVDAELRARVRAACDEWEADGSLLHQWVRFVLGDVLGLPAEVLRDGPALPPGLSVAVAEHDETLRPDVAVVAPGGGVPRLLVQVWPAAQPLDGRVRSSRWAASPRERLAELLRRAACRLGLCTNGGTWTLVAASPGQATTYVSWDAGLWAEEPLTLRSFRTLLCAHRFFAVPERDTLEGLLQRSAAAQEEVTSQLGAQVRASVETLVDTLDRADRDAGGRLLREVSHEVLYRAAVTVMMRLVFLFYAEENLLLPLGDPLYDASYAASTLRAQLQDEADRQGEDPLERRHAAWHRLLAAFRLVHGGVQHEQLRLPAHGGGLFDPEAYPFLEGRREGEPWREEPQAQPLPVDDRTVLHLLDSLQVLRTPGQEARRLSFRALDVEQIGHVYEGLLDHVAVEAEAPAVGLEGRREPEIALALIEERAARGREPLVAFLAEETGRTQAAVERALERTLEAPARARLRAACQNDEALLARVLPYHGLIRVDYRGQPRVFVPRSVYVTRGSERRSSGTYYTPRTLAEEVVRYALEPLAYSPGPAEGADPSEWRLRPSSELLDLRVCDLSMGSGAFLVATCRWLAERLLEAWAAEGAAEALGEPIPGDADDRLNFARRLVAERCLYGVDLNPMAVDMAKLSLWLVTMARGRPFTFVDHALKEGDSLLGVTSAEQLAEFHLDPRRGREIAGNPFGWRVSGEPLLRKAVELRRRLESFSVRDVRDAEAKAALQREVDDLLADLRVVGDVLVGAALSTATSAGDAFDDRVLEVRKRAAEALDPGADAGERALALEELRTHATYWLDEGRPKGASAPSRRPFHWPLQFSEVFLDRPNPGFSAVVGNPPFMGGQRITGALGSDYREHLVRWIAGNARGSADLCAYFFLRASGLVRREGSISLLATNTIAQGDTREVGLDRLLDGAGWSIGRAVKSRPWPGGANLEISEVWLRKGEWGGRPWLDGTAVPAITARLDPRGRVEGPAHRLAENAGKSFQGSIVLGLGFTMPPEEARWLIERDARNADVLFPYLNGEDLNGSPDQSPGRWVIQFDERTEGQARAYQDVWRIAEERIKPERMTKDAAKYPRMVYEWWKHWNNRRELAAAIAALRRILVITRHSKTVLPAFINGGVVCSEATVVFAYDDDVHLALLTSAFHYWWAVTRASTMRTDLRYTPSDCFDTFPQPALTDELGAAGLALDTHRRQLMLDRWEGLTRTYNRVHNPAETSADIARLRELHVELDHAVARAYDWDDLDLDHGFHDTRQGVRFTIGPAARVEVLDRLLGLNHDRYRAEVERGLHASKKARSAQLTIEGL
jgi:hypothetical protein